MMWRLFILIFAWLLLGVTAQAETKRYASIVVDADTLEIIHARQIDALRFPASLTKVMTLYLTFDALNAGHLQLDSQLPVSRYAARTAPSKLGLRAGQMITVQDLIQAVAVKSANDAAVVLAEKIGGSEAGFAAMMTAKAQSLGMRNSQFYNPHGLPHEGQKTTARDMAKLASAVLNNHRRYYHYFGQKTFRYNGRTYKNTNGLLHNMANVDGFKTGFTAASGYNLIISAQKEGRRLIAIVLGGATGNSRNMHMADLIRRGFKTLGVAPPALAPVTVVSEPVPVLKAPQIASTTKTRKSQAIAKTPVITKAVRLRGRSGAKGLPQSVTVIDGDQTVKLASLSLDNAWSVQVGAFATGAAAQEHLTVLSALPSSGLQPANARVLPLRRGQQILYRSRFTGLSLHEAQEACHALSNLAAGCKIITPGG